MYLVLEKLFGDDAQKEIDSIMLAARTKSLSRSCTEDDDKVLIMVPTPDVLSAALNNYTPAGSMRRSYVNMGFNFFTFCRAIYQHVEYHCGGNVFEMMDPIQLPISTCNSSLQREKSKCLSG